MRNEFFVSDSEKIVDEFEVGNTGVCITDKRLYVVREVNESSDEEVVERSQITGVRIKKEAQKKRKVGISGFIIGIVLFILGFVFIDGGGIFNAIASISFIAGVVVLVINIISFFVKTKTEYRTVIEINVTSHTISIIVPTTNDVAYLDTIKNKLYKLLNENNLTA